MKAAMGWKAAVAAVTLAVLVGLASLSGQAATEFTGPAEQFTFALKLYKDQIYELSAEQFAELRQRFPEAKEAKEALYYLGDCYFRLGTSLRLPRLGPNWLLRSRSIPGWRRYGINWGRLMRKVTGLRLPSRLSGSC